MKIMILTLIAIIGFTSVVPARDPANIKVQLGQSKAADGGKVTIKFLSVEEDSRCPVNARCIWAGNAKIKVAVSIGKAAPKTIELSSELEPQAVVVSGYELKFVDLTPRPGEKEDSPKTATISVTRSH